MNTVLSATRELSTIRNVMITIAGIICLLFLLLIIEKHLKKNKTVAVYMLLFAYIICYLSVTLLFRVPNNQLSFSLVPGKALAIALGIIKSSKLQSNAATDIVLNVLLYVPLGVLLPTCMKSVRKSTVKRVLLSAFVISFITEMIQLICRTGVFETDDIMHNCIGAILGGGIYTKLFLPIQKETGYTHEKENYRKMIKSISVATNENGEKDYASKSADRRNSPV